MITDYLGSTRKTHLVRRTKRAMQAKICNYCKNTKFDVYKKKSSSCNYLPHLDTAKHGQIVLGRVRTLAKYGYDRCKYFLPLTLPYEYESKPGNLFWTIKINDLFMYCSQRRRYALPIRLVVDPTPQGPKNKVTKRTVTWREEQQLLRYFKMYKYKSLTHPGVYFFSKRPDVRYKNIVRIKPRLTN